MDKYLLQILHDVNTIIIPGLGALTVTNAKTGEMMFMSYLKYDDGKLANYISEKEGMSENDAKNLIAKYVREIQSKLDKGDTYDMFQFGRFLKNKDGDVDFESWGTYASVETSASSAAQQLSTESADETGNSEEEITEQPTNPEPETEEIEIPIPEEITPTEDPEITFEPDLNENQPHTEEITVPEFLETAEAEDKNTEDDGIFDDLTVMPTPPASTSLDEMLASTEAQQPSTEAEQPSTQAQQADENQVSSTDQPFVEDDYIQPSDVEEKVVSTEYEQPSAETIPEVKPDPIVVQTQDESRVQVENIYIPPGETVVEPEKPAPDLTKKKTPKPEPQPKKKRGAGFWILIILIILLVVGGATTMLFYDKVKTYLPFLESKRVEAEQQKDSAVSAEELNENAAALEAAENERVANENQPQEAPAENTEGVEEPAVVEEPAPAEPAASSNDGSQPYHVIGGAFGNKENADRYASKNSGTVIGQYGGMHLVSLGSYASKQEANSAINGKSWVFKKP